MSANLHYINICVFYLYRKSAENSVYGGFNATSAIHIALQFQTDVGCYTWIFTNRGTPPQFVCTMCTVQCASNTVPIYTFTRAKHQDLQIDVDLEALNSIAVAFMLIFLQEPVMKINCDRFNSKM